MEGTSVRAGLFRQLLMKKNYENSSKTTHFILFLISSGSGGLGLLTRQIATQPTTMMDEMIMPAASTKAAITIV